MSANLGPIPPQVTNRVLDLLQVAADALAQAAYEGSHTLRQDPEPAYGTPWNRPDLPASIAAELAQVREALDALSDHAVEDADDAEAAI